MRDVTWPRRSVTTPLHLGISVVACASVLTSGCFYLSDKNERPRATINQKTTGPYTVTDSVVLNALGSVDDRLLSGSEFVWEAFHCDEFGANCQSSGNRLTLPTAASEFAVSPFGKGILRVDLLIRDVEGAFDKTSLELPIVNQAPTAALQVSENFPDPGDFGGHVLGLPVELAAQLLDADGDPLTVAWNYDPPLGGGSNPANVVFEPTVGFENVFTLIGDVPGVWEVTVRATDDSDAETVATAQVVFAPDRPPCIALLSPASAPGQTVVVSGAARSFSVLRALDALDPHPPLQKPHPAIGETSFRWSVASPANGNILTELDRSVSEMVIDPGDFSPGERLTLRVELFDRLAEPVACPANEPSCSADDNECRQRMTWELVVR